MRILIDTNIVLSAIISPNGHTARMLKFAMCDEHILCLCTFRIDELRLVIKRKFPDKMLTLEEFLAELSYELLLTPVVLPQVLPSIRDANDLPILASAMVGDVDILLTGDKDFENLDLERPAILTPARFMLLYGR